jgi:hypothetical protein
LIPLTLANLLVSISQIDVEEPCGKEIFLHCINGQNKTKIFCQVNAPIPPISFDHYWFTTYYSNRRICQPYVMCCEKFKAGQRRDNSEIEASLAEGWKVLNELHYRTPYGPRDARVSTAPDSATCDKQRICVASAIKGEHAGRHFF